jgi:RNA polymerase sigma-B factor
MRAPSAPPHEDALLEEFMPLARSLARRYARSGAPSEELEHVAAIGLLKAARRFDPDRGTPFGAFATPTITGEVRRHFRDTAWALHVPRALQELALRVNRLADELEHDTGRPPTPADIAERGRLRVDEVLEGREVLCSRNGVPLDAPDEDEPGLGHADRLGAPDAGFRRVENAQTVQWLLSLLDPRDREIVRLRFWEDLTQAEIAGRLGVSQMQVSRRLQRALERMGQAAHAPAMAA